MNRVLTLLLVASAGAICLCAPATAETVEEILSRHVTALGGEAILRDVTSLRRTGSLSFESSFGPPMSGGLEMIIVPERKVYTSSRLGAFSTTAAWDGVQGWERGPQGLRMLEGEELVQLAVQSRLFFSTDLFDPNGSVERLEDREIDGVPHYTLRYRTEGVEITAYMDQATHLITQLATPLTLPGVGQTVSVTDLWDYRSYDGVLLPESVTTSIEGVFTSEVVFGETVVNGPVDEARFAVPVEGSTE